MENKELPLIDKIMEEINNKWQEVSTQLYDDTVTEENTQKSEDPDNTTDVEFEEVK